MSRAEVLELAMKLPAAERVALADELIASLDPPGEECTGEEWERACMEEVKARLESYDRGESVPLDGKQMFAEIRARRQARP